MLNPSMPGGRRRFRLAAGSAGQEKESVGAASTGAVWRRLLPFGGGLLALLMAGWGEAIVELHDSSLLSLLLYLAAIALFFVSGWPLRPAPVDLPAPDALPDTAAEMPSQARSRRIPAWAIVGGGAAAAILLDIISFSMLHNDLRSQPGAYLWLASMLVLLGTAAAVSRRQGWAARWGVEGRPLDTRRRLLLGIAVAGILGLAAAARLLWLDRVPFGINADEGDRGAVAIQIIHGDNTSSIFDAGWYYISMLYFWVLAGVMKVAGVGWVGARVFGALASIVSVGVVTMIGARNFGVRVGLLAGLILSGLAISLQFAR